MNTNRHEVGRRQGGQPYITFGYHRRPPAMPRARGRRPDLRAAAPAADPGRMVMWLYDSYIIYQMMGTKTRPSRTRKHHGPEGRTESKICVSRGRNVPSEISYKKLAIRFSRLAAGSLLAASLLPLRLLLRLLVSAAAY